MDGVKRGVSHSLQTRLCLWLSIVLLCSALIAGLLAFQSAFQEVHELQDDMLRQIAAMYDLQRLQFHGGLDLGGKVVRDDESRVFVEVLPSGASPPGAAVSSPPVVLPPGLPDGIHSVRAAHKTYRVLIKTLGKGGRLAVAQETEVRDEIARDNALHTIMPFLILIPVLLLVVSGLVRKIFVPVRQLSAEIDRRGDKDLHRIPSESLPKEIRPFVEAINSLLGRVEQSLSAQLRFVADAAHELRSPLTALSLQAERLSGSEMSSRAHARLDTLRKGIERGRVLVEQLLALARVQASAIAPGVRSSVQQAYRCVLEDLLPLAEIKNIDIGVTSDFDALVPLDEVSLITLVKNLVNNAIVYTPVGGRIDLSVAPGDGGVIMLVVEDSGPGIPEAERNRVFDPFHRIPGSDQIGSGLGLSIVRAIASRCDAAVHLDFADEQSKTGLRVTVVFPVS